MQVTWRQKYLRYKSFLLNTVDRYEERTDVRIYLEILLSLITISIFSVFALRPTILTIAELIKEIEAKEQLITKLDDKIQTITTAQILYDRQRENIRILKEAIPNSPENDELIYQLEGLVGNNNVSVGKVTIGETALLRDPDNPQQSPSQQAGSEENSTFTTFGMQLTGDYLSLFSFMKDMETLIKPVNIVNSSIISEEDKETGDITLRLILSAQVPFKTLKQNINQ